MTLGNRIRQCRTARGLTLQQVGDTFGISRTSVSGWERDLARPDIEKLVELARLLGTSTDYLLVGRNPSTAANQDTWPFTRVSREEFEALPASERLIIEGYILRAVEDHRNKSRARSAA